MFIIAPAILAFTSLLFVVGYRVISIQQRRRRLANLELRPNCLLTRSPVVFVTGRRSLFYFLNYWNEIPDFLKEHGYDTRVLPLPWRGFDARYKSLSSFIESCDQPVHLVADLSSKAEVERLLLTKRSRISSLNFAEQITGEPHLQKAIGLKTDDLWSVESKYLDHVIQLAEDEHS